MSNSIPPASKPTVIYEYDVQKEGADRKQLKSLIRSTCLFDVEGTIVKVLGAVTVKENAARC